MERIRHAFSLLMLLTCLLGSSLQGFISQTHLHPARGLSAAAGTIQFTPMAPAEPACLLCEVSAHSPALLPSGAAAVVLPIMGHVLADPVLPLAPLSRASHHWRGRGPPAR